MLTPSFRPCRQHQMMLLPPDLSELIPQNSMVRLIDEIVDGMGRLTLESAYSTKGAPAYDPAMMLKVILFCYASGIYSSRKIARATAENINLMWLTGMHPLDHNTINRFRTERIRPIFEDIFIEVISVIADAGYISLDAYFLDGTKIEAASNKYTFVWKKSTDRYQQALRAKVHAHLEAIDEMEEEEEELAPEDPEEVDSERIREAARRINERLSKKRKEGKGKSDKAKELRRASKALERDYLPKMEKYETYQEILGGRGSFSKTDPDATFMRLKDDAMRNGQTKAAYNIQAGTENQFIVDVTVHQHPTDTACLIDHCEHFKDLYMSLPTDFTADAGYGSEENYLYLEEEGVDAYVKHSEFYRECKSRKWREDEMRVANWPWDADRDVYTCPEGRELSFDGVRKRTSKSGFASTSRIYRCDGCEGCPRHDVCVKSEDPSANRSIQINPRLSFFKKRASEMLHTEKGRDLRKRRGIEVETVFGDIKRNAGFTRFLLRGLDKVTHEMRLVATAHNIRKLFYEKTRNRMEGAMA